MLATARVGEVISAGNPGVFMHGPTFMANPLACRVAAASIHLLRESDWQGQVVRIEGGLRQGLAPCRTMDQVQDVRVLGAIGVVELQRPVVLRRYPAAFCRAGCLGAPLRPSGLCHAGLLYGGCGPADPDRSHLRGGRDGDRTMTTDLSAALAGLAEKGRLRELRPLTDRNGCRVRYNGREMFNLTSNDYLGLAGDAGLHEQFYSRISTSVSLLDEYGLGSASSRLLTGDSPMAHQLEGLLARAYDRPAALLFNSGYHANIGILPALLGRNDLILSDKLNHASIHDGMRLSQAAHKRYRHCDYDHLTEILRQYRERP